MRMTWFFSNYEEADAFRTKKADEGYMTILDIRYGSYCVDWFIS